MTTTVTAIRLPRAPREPGPGEQALATLYKKHADELAAIEAAYKAGPPGPRISYATVRPAAAAALGR